MEDGANPYVIIGILACLAIAELIGIIVLYRRSKQENVTEEDVISLVNEGHEDGNILASEAAMIQNIFEFSDTDVKDIMTHRKNIVAIDGDLTLREAISFINDNNMSRYPVYIEDLDNIIGILHINEKSYPVVMSHRIIYKFGRKLLPGNNIGDLVKFIVAS